MHLNLYSSKKAEEPLIFLHQQFGFPHWEAYSHWALVRNPAYHLSWTISWWEVGEVTGLQSARNRRRCPWVVDASSHCPMVQAAGSKVPNWQPREDCPTLILERRQEREVLDKNRGCSDFPNPGILSDLLDNISVPQWTCCQESVCTGRAGSSEGGGPRWDQMSHHQLSIMNFPL